MEKKLLKNYLPPISHWLVFSFILLGVSENKILRHR